MSPFDPQRLAEILRRTRRTVGLREAMKDHFHEIRTRCDDEFEQRTGFRPGKNEE